MRTRRKYTDEFKREAVRLASSPGSSIASVATDLGIDRSVVADWVKKTRQGRYEPTPGKPLKTESQGELEQLRRELAKVKMERDILKKALGYFAKDPTRGSASLPNIARCGRFESRVRSWKSRPVASMNGSAGRSASAPGRTKS